MSIRNILNSASQSWLAPLPASGLGILRAAIGGYGLWYVWTRCELICGFAGDSNLLYEPVGLFRLFPAPIDQVAVEWMVIATIITGIFFVAGLAFRYTGPAFAILLLATLCFRNSWSMIYHMHNALVVHVLILGFSRSADGFSLDAWLANPKEPADKKPAWQYGWPVRLICGVTAISYFLAGFAKVVGPDGWAWAAGQTLRDQIAVDTIRKEVLEGGGMDAAFLLYDQVWLFTLLGIGTFVLELGAPLFALNRWTGRLWAIMTFTMHWGIYLIMGIKFRYQMSFILFLSFFPVHRCLPVRKEAGIPSSVPGDARPSLSGASRL